MDLQKTATYVSAAAVVGTGSLVGGNYAVDQATGGPEKRAKVQESELRQIIREEVTEVLVQAWPKQTSGITGLKLPNTDYRNQVPPQK